MLQVAEKLRTDPRVVVIDRTNLRYLQLKDLPGDAAPMDLVSLDLSFISVLKVMPVVCELLRPGGVLIVLVKPQFEANRDQVTPVSFARTGFCYCKRAHAQKVAGMEVMCTLSAGGVGESHTMQLHS